MLTVGQLKKATASTTANATIFLPHIISTLTAYGINTPIRQLCFLAQVGHESGGLFYTEELASGSAYESRVDLGNTQKGDGIKFKGRGLIQITGRANYQTLSNALGENFITNPTKLGGKNIGLCTPAQLKFAALSAGWFWHTHNLNAIADKIIIGKPLAQGSNNLKFFIQITRRINGGENGLQDRVNRYVGGRPYFI